MAQPSGTAAGRTAGSRKADAADTVDAFMARLDHPQHATIQALRGLIREADAGIVEAIQWNAPSFRTREYFATVNLREKAGVGVILHLGAKVRPLASVPVDDPAQLLHWLAKDRAMIVVRDAADLASKADAVQALIRRWIAYV